MNVPIADRYNEYRRPIFFPESISLSIGLPEVPICTRSGEERVQLKLVRPVVLHKSHENLVLNFHRFIIKEVLRLERRPLEFIGRGLLCAPSPQF